MALKDDLIATDKDKIAGRDVTIDMLRNLLRDVYELTPDELVALGITKVE